MLLLKFLLEHLKVQVSDLSEEFLTLDVEILADLWHTGSGNGIVVLESADSNENLSLFFNDLFGELGISRDGVLGLESQR